MKKVLSVFLCLFFSMTLFTVTVSASSDEITVEIDGKTVEFDVKPEIINGNTMVPLRKIFEEIGANVKWNNDTQTVSARKNSKTVSLSINSTELQIDKGDTDEAGNPIYKKVTLEVPAQLVSRRTLVPLRAISESFGLNVDWNADNKKVIITSKEDDDDSWKENISTINLDKMTYEGNGVEIIDNQIKITQGGDFTVSGTLSDGNITISTKEKVKIRLSGAKITSSENPCIFVEDADKAYITLSAGTENFLTAKNSEDGAIYSKENLEIKGDGKLHIESITGHGIKASDNLTIENGTISINAKVDGIHINDTFKMIGGAVNITSVCDGIDCESIVNILGGTINIETTASPIESTDEETSTTQNAPHKGMWAMDEADVEFEKSTKGINAEWMMIISDGVININSASHTIHCQDEIEINGGNFTLSSKYDKGISAHGNLTINGDDTVIDISKSTEGIESKKVLTVNAGNIKIISTDDAINATGGNSGTMPFMEMGNMVRPEKPKLPEGNKDGTTTPMPQRPNKELPADMEFPFNGKFPPLPEDWEFPTNGEMPQRPQFGGNMGGMGKNMKNCLIINGGNIEACGSDDCIDANGNIVINGGIIKASNPTGSFTGNFGVLDADGQLTISKDANIILASANGNERGLKLAQNYIIVYCKTLHEANEIITLTDSTKNVIYEYAPKDKFKAILIASENIKTGEKYTITISDEIFETEITQQNTSIGTQVNEGMGFNKGKRPH